MARRRREGHRQCPDRRRRHQRTCTLLRCPGRRHRDGKAEEGRAPTVPRPTTTPPAQNSRSGPRVRTAQGRGGSRAESPATDENAATCGFLRCPGAQVPRWQGGGRKGTDSALTDDNAASTELAERTASAYGARPRRESGREPGDRRERRDVRARGPLRRCGGRGGRRARPLDQARSGRTRPASTRPRAAPCPRRCRIRPDRG